MKRLLLIVAQVLVSFLLASRIASADNLVANASAEQMAANGMPEGWGVYVGAGGMKFTASAKEKHRGQRADCLELTEWYRPKDAVDAEADRSISGAIVLAANNGYSAAGALVPFSVQEFRVFAESGRETYLKESLRVSFA